MIYLVGKQKFKGVKNLILSEIKLCEFSVDLRDFDALIITSKNALLALQKSSQSVLDFSVAVYAVGEKSAKMAQNLGFTNVKTPPKAYGKDLFKAFKNELKGKKCLYLRAKKIASNLDELLLNEGVNLTQIIAYKNVPKPISQGFKLKRPAVFIFTAPSSVKNFLTHFSLDKNDKCVAIGQSTASALREILGCNFDDKKDLKSENLSEFSTKNLSLKNTTNSEFATANLAKNSQNSPNLTQNLPQIFVPQTQSIKACVELARVLV